MITDEDRKILLGESHKTLAEWWNIFNHWDWPDEIPNEEPPAPYIARGRRTALMNWIEDEVGHRLISRVHNKDMNDEEFEDFYRGSFKGDKEAKKRYWKRLEERTKIDEG